MILNIQLPQTLTQVRLTETQFAQIVVRMHYAIFSQNKEVFLVLKRILESAVLIITW